MFEITYLKTVKCFRRRMAVSHEPQTNFFSRPFSSTIGPNNSRARKPGVPGESIMDRGAIDIKKGGDAIPYCEEDPYLLKEFKEALAREGSESRMDPLWYDPDTAEDSQPKDLFLVGFR